MEGRPLGRAGKGSLGGESPSAAWDEGWVGRTAPAWRLLAGVGPGRPRVAPARRLGGGRLLGGRCAAGGDRASGLGELPRATSYPRVPRWKIGGPCWTYT